jgi:hypothetical protein
VLFFALAGIFQTWFNRVAHGARTLWAGAFASVVDSVWRLVSDYLSQSLLDQPLNGSSKGVMPQVQSLKAISFASADAKHKPALEIDHIMSTRRVHGFSPVSLSSRCRPEPARPPPFRNHAIAPDFSRA